MIPQSILDMINDATKKAYILTALEYIKEECKSHFDDIADEHDRPYVCAGCPFDNGINCFFNAGFDERIPQEWDLKELERRLQNDKR